MSKRFALLVGMTAYPDDRLGATASNKEIRTLVEQLRDPENGRFDRVIPLLNQTALDLQLGIASFFEQEMEPGDLVLFYFAGHSLIHHQNIYLATIDTFTEEYLDATTVEIDFIRRRLNASVAQQIVVLDCDFSLIGATDRHIDGLGMLADAFQAEKRAVVIAPQLTAPLVHGMQGAADANQDGMITFAEWSAYVQSQLPEAQPPTIATHEDLDGLPLAFCAVGKKAAPAVPIVPPSSPFPTAESAKPSSKRRRYGIIALFLLLLLIAFGVYANSRGLFAADGSTETQPDPSATTAVIAIAPDVDETPSLVPTTEVEETAVVTETVTLTATHTPTAEATTTPQATATATNTPTAAATTTPSTTPEPTATEASTPTAEPTVANSPTPGATSEPVPMNVVAQQAFLRAGPGINYRILAFPTQGTAVTVIARNGDATWYNVILEDGSSGWLHVDVLAAADDDAFAGISVAATIPAPIDDFYDPILTPSGDSLSLQVYHTYVGTRGDNARLQARLLPETDLIQPTYPSGQQLGLGLLIVEFNRVGDGAYTSNQMELCMVSETGISFYCETVPARKSW